MIRVARSSNLRKPNSFTYRSRVHSGLLVALVSLVSVRAACAQSEPVAPATGNLPSPSSTSSDRAAAVGGTQTAPTSDSVPTIPTPARAPTFLQPFTGTAPDSGGLRDQTVANLGAPLDRAARNWNIVPSIGLGEEYTSNVLATAGSGRGYDFVTLVTPSVAVSGVTTRLQGSLNYAPEIDVYARNFNQSRVNQNFGGDLLATLLPGTAFLDLRAFGAVTTNGLSSSGGTSTATTNGQTQSLAFSASPYILHRFGSYGTGEIGASLQRSSSNAVAGNYTATSNAFFNSGNQNLTTYSGHAAFQTGEFYNRYQGTALLYANEYSGTGVLQSAARDTATLNNGYAVTRFLTLLGEIGYEHIRYSGTQPIRIDDEIWNAGFRFTLGPNSFAEAGYGHHDGFSSFNLKASLQPTARTRLFATYSEGLDTESEQLQTALSTSDFDLLGNPVDHTTGAPLLLAPDGFFGAQNNLYRTQRLSVTASLLENRDTFSVSLNAENNRLVSSANLAPGSPGYLANSLGSNKGVYGSLTWSRELTPTLRATSFLQYGVRSYQGGASADNVFNASVAVIKLLSETLSAQLRVTYNSDSNGYGAAINQVGFIQSQSRLDQAIVLLSATKSF